MRQSRIFVGMVLILIFAEVLGLYGYGSLGPGCGGSADRVQTYCGSHHEHKGQRLKRCTSFTTSCTVPVPAETATCQYSHQVQHKKEAGACDISGRIARRYLGVQSVFAKAVTWGCQEQRWASMRCPNKLFESHTWRSRPYSNDVLAVTWLSGKRLHFICKNEGWGLLWGQYRSMPTAFRCHTELIQSRCNCMRRRICNPLFCDLL